MTDDRQVSVVLESWLAEGPIQMPDRVFDTVADRIQRQPQRPAWRLDWRRYAMNTNAKIAVALVAALVVAVLGYNLLPAGSTGIGGPAASPSPSATASPTPVASPIAISSTTFRPTVRLVAPPGWTIVGDGERAFVLSGPAGSSGAPAGAINVMTGPFVNVEDPDCGGRAAAGLGGSVTETIDSLSGDPRLTTAAAGPVRLWDLSGQALDIGLSPSWTGTCTWSQGEPAAVLLMATDQGPAFGIGGSEQSRLILLDVQGSFVAIVLSWESNSVRSRFLAETTPIVDSIRLGP